MVFDSEGKRFDSSKEKANIDICDGKDYFMACRVIGVGLEGVPAALTSNPSPARREPAVPTDNARDITEKSIRLDGLKLKSDRTKAGEPVEFSDVITNVGEKEVAIPGNDFANVIAINYGWEAISESAKMTKVTPGIGRFGNVVAAGGAQFAFLHQSTLAPAEKLVFQDKIAPFEPLAPGQYRLHVYLFSRYATELNKPEQELFQELPSFCNPVVLSGNGQDRAASRCRSDRPLLRSSAMSHMLEKDISRDPPSTPACSDHQSVLLSTRGFTNGGAF